MLEALSSLIALQALDTAAETARKRISDVPDAERALAAAVAETQVVTDEARAKVSENNSARRALEKDVAAVDARMAKFEEHKASVKTNEQFQALNHEIEVAQTSKSALEDQIIALMDEADTLEATLTQAEAVLAQRQRTAKTEHQVLHADVTAQEAELIRLAAARAEATTLVPQEMLGKYEQMLKGRKGVAVAAMVAGTCTACHVALRPHLQQQVRRNDGIALCDSCQRILYYVAPPPRTTPSRHLLERHNPMTSPALVGQTVSVRSVSRTAATMRPAPAPSARYEKHRSRDSAVQMRDTWIAWSGTPAWISWSMLACHRSSFHRSMPSSVIHSAALGVIARNVFRTRPST